jgi:antitoxin PrlF
MASTLTVKGQVTIPKLVRKHLGVGPGSAVAFRRNDRGEIVIEPADGSKTESPFEALRGQAGRGMTTDEIMALTRGEK